VTLSQPSGESHGSVSEAIRRAGSAVRWSHPVGCRRQDSRRLRRSARTAFESYVGGSFDASSLTMILIVPTDVTWLKGDRTIACVALSSSGAKLTGSIRGTGR
jgi:hypothetical protein